MVVCRRSTRSGGEVSFEGVEGDEWLLDNTDKLADSDLVNEIAAWKRKYVIVCRGQEC